MLLTMAERRRSTAYKLTHGCTVLAMGDLDFCFKELKNLCSAKVRVSELQQYEVKIEPLSTARDGHTAARVGTETGKSAAAPSNAE